MKIFKAGVRDLLVMYWKVLGEGFKGEGYKGDEMNRETSWLK